MKVEINVKKSLKKAVIQTASKLRYIEGKSWAEINEEIKNFKEPAGIINLEEEVNIYYKKHHEEMEKHGYSKPYIPREYYGAVLNAIELMATGERIDDACVYTLEKERYKTRKLDKDELEAHVKARLKAVLR